MSILRLRPVLALGLGLIAVFLPLHTPSGAAAAAVRSELAVWAPPTLAQSTSIAAITDGLSWMSMDMHLHTDHSSDAGVFHQQFDTPDSHDTFLDEQRDQAILLGMDAVAFTDHRTFDQHFDPEFATDDAILMTGEEWGGGRHGTAFGIVERLDHDNDYVDCGLAQASFEAAAQDALFGIAHPKDVLTGSCGPSLETVSHWPISHVEAVRGGDGPVQEAGLAEPNGANTLWYDAALAAGARLAAINGSDNHFKQVWAGPSGPGGSSTAALVREHSASGWTEAVRARRTLGGWTEANVRMTMLLDADQDGTFDALMGDWAAPSGETVHVAVRAEQGTGGWVQVLDDTGAVVAETPVVLPDETFVFTLPAASRSYRAGYTLSTVTQLGLPDPLDYVDTLMATSSPVWTIPPAETGSEEPALAGEAPVALGRGAWSGFADVASVGDVLHVVWQERPATSWQVAYGRSVDGGVTWEDPRVLSRSADARLPTIGAAGDRVTVAWEDHDPGRLGGPLVVATSEDGGATFDDPEIVVPGPTWRAELAAGGAADHLVWSAPLADGTWSVHHAARADAGHWSTPAVLSSAAATDGPMTQYAVPPRTIEWIPASINPSVAVEGDTVLVVWEDNREDPTPGRSGSPDDWGIWAVTSTDGGTTFSAGARVSPRVLRKDEPADPEGVEGNPARNAAAAIVGDGALLVIYQDTAATGKDGIVAMRSDGVGSPWGEPVNLSGEVARFETHPSVAVSSTGDITVTWQRDADPAWVLTSAISTDGGRTFSDPTQLTTTGRYHGWPSVADGVLVWTAERSDGTLGVHVAASSAAVEEADEGPDLPATGATSVVILGLVLVGITARRRRLRVGA